MVAPTTRHANTWHACQRWYDVESACRGRLGLRWLGEVNDVACWRSFIYCDVCVNQQVRVCQRCQRRAHFRQCNLNVLLPTWKYQVCGEARGVLTHPPGLGRHVLYETVSIGRGGWVVATFRQVWPACESTTCWLAPSPCRRHGRCYSASRRILSLEHLNVHRKTLFNCCS